MNALDRWCLQCGGEPQYLSVLATRVPKVVQGTKTGSAMVIKDTSLLILALLFLVLLLVLLARNRTHEDGNSGTNVHC